jgi:hypothetical protein
MRQFPGGAKLPQRRAVELLLNRLNGNAPAAFVHEYPAASLVVRQSTALLE